MRSVRWRVGALRQQLVHRVTNLARACQFRVHSGKSGMQPLQCQPNPFQCRNKARQPLAPDPQGQAP